MRRTLVVAVLLVGLVAHRAPRGAETPHGQPVFRVGVDLVTIDVVATANGAPVHNLTAADFELFEDGVLQKVQAFQFINLSNTSAVNPLPPGIASNEVEPGGLFALVLDEIGVYVTEVTQMRRVAEKFLKESLLPQDHVAVVRSGADSGFFLTMDRAMALDMVLSASGRRDRGLMLEGAGALEQGLVGIDARAPGDTGKQSFGVLEAVIERLRPIPARRKAILWFSRGGELPPDVLESLELGLPVGRDESAFLRLVEGARAANVAIYTIDPRGLVAPGTDNREGPTPSDIEELGTLRDLASATGGRALVNANDLSGILTRVAAENRAYYLLGYEPTAAAAGKSRARKISVRTRAPGVSLLHRKVYLPSAGDKRTKLNLIESPLPVTGLPIELAPAAVAGERSRRGLVVPFEVGGELPDGTEVQYTVVALDPAGKVAGRSTGVVNATAGHALGEARLTVDAKSYQVRVAATIAGDTTRQGLAFAAVDVPAGKSKPAQCSGFVFEQPGERPALRQFTRGAPITISTVISAEKLNDRAITFGLGSVGGPVERSWPVSVGKPLANGLWRVALSLKPPLPGGHAEIRVMDDGFLIDESCRTEFVLR